MSFKSASAILRGKWLIDKQWANNHMPLVFSFMKGDATAGAMLMGSNSNEDYISEVELVDGTKNVYEVCCDTDLSKLPYGSIALVDIDGPMMKQGDDCSYGMEDYAELMGALKMAANVPAVIIDIDSPGGQVDGTASFADAIASLAKIKTVIGLINDGMSASAAYWAISACSEVYCTQPTSQAGSIGVYCTIADWNAYYENQGLKVQDVYAPQSTDKNVEMREALAGNTSLLEDELKFIANEFIAAVKKNRKGKVTGNDWAGGKLYFAADAQAQGLIDGIKTFDQVVFRLTRLISSKNKNSTMAFEKTLVVANAESFAVTDEGFVLSEDQLNAVETALNENAAAINIEALEQANATIIEVTAARDIAVQQYEASQETLNSINESISARDMRISELEAQLAQFTNGSSGGGSTLTVAQDENTEHAAEPKGVLDPNHPANVEARKKISIAQSKKQFKN